MEREGVSSLSIHVFHGLLGTCSFYKIACVCVFEKLWKCLSAAIQFMVTLVSVLKSVKSVLKTFV